MVDCQGGQITLAGRVIHDDKSDRGMGVVTVATALARSSDVAAVKMALKVGPDRFYQYIRNFGFGSRTGLELPGETRGLLRPTNRWNGSSIGSIAIGQEVGVTPVQLVSMVSTIANGGTYFPPRILMPNQIGSVLDPVQKSAAPQVPASPQGTPLQGAQVQHRVISELAAAQMRKMMEGVVLYGTGKPAQLNGYSSGGKTGTAQKIDPVTHLYSKTMHIASFAGIAPVNNPAIAVAVVMDNPKGAAYYGTTVSAPVFAEVAQQVLEYLGVPHDIDVQQPKTPAKKEPKSDLAEDDSAADQNNVNSLFAAVNDLPADDPLRTPPQPAPQPVAVPPATTPNDKAAAPSAVPLDQRPASPQGAASLIQKSATPQVSQVSQVPALQVSQVSQTSQVLTISDGRKLIVPTLVGLPMRKVIELASTAGLDVQIIGNGTARQQAPAPGSKVHTGTRIVVHCTQ